MCKACSEMQNLSFLGESEGMSPRKLGGSGPENVFKMHAEVESGTF